MSSFILRNHFSFPKGKQPIFPFFLRKKKRKGVTGTWQRPSRTVLPRRVPRLPWASLPLAGRRPVRALAGSGTVQARGCSHCGRTRRRNRGLFYAFSPLKTTFPRTSLNSLSWMCNFVYGDKIQLISHNKTYFTTPNHVSKVSQLSCTAS